MAGQLIASLRRLRAVAVKEVRQLSRDRVTFGMIVGVPMMQMLLFGFAINFDVRNLATVVLDQANSSMSREFLSQLKATQVVNVKYITDSSAELDQLMREGRASMAVVIPPRLRAPAAIRFTAGGADPGGWLATQSLRCGRGHRADAAARAARRGPVRRWQAHDAAAHRDPHAVQPREAHGRADRARR